MENDDNLTAAKSDSEVNSQQEDMHHEEGASQNADLDQSQNNNSDDTPHESDGGEKKKEYSENDINSMRFKTAALSKQLEEERKVREEERRRYEAALHEHQEVVTALNNTLSQNPEAWEVIRQKRIASGYPDPGDHATVFGNYRPQQNTRTTQVEVEDEETKFRANKVIAGMNEFLTENKELHPDYAGTLEEKKEREAFVVSVFEEADKIIRRGANLSPRQIIDKAVNRVYEDIGITDPNIKLKEAAHNAAKSVAGAPPSRQSADRDTEPTAEDVAARIKNSGDRKIYLDMVKNPMVGKSEAERLKKANAYARKYLGV